jgi:DNA-binding MarR family transcriptional regulator
MSKEQTPTMTKCREVAARCACFNLRKATRAVTQLYDDTFREVGIRATQFTLLVAAHLAGEMPISQMAEILVMDRTTLTRNLKPLETQGLIAVRTGVDRREKLIALTVHGRALVAKALPVWEEVQLQVIKGLGPAKFESLLSELSGTVALTHA